MPTLTGRRRSTKAETDHIKDAIYDMASADHPVSVRHIFYRVVSAGLVDKTDAGYKQVQRFSVDLRRSGRIPYNWFADSSRRAYWINSYDSVAGEFARQVANLYRRDYWTQTDTLVEVWCESRSLAAVVQSVCEDYAVPLFPAGGFASLSFLYDAAEHIADSDRSTAAILYAGDYDPAGVLIDQKIHQTLQTFLQDRGWQGNLTFNRLAVNPEQIDQMGLIARPRKETDRRSKEVTQAVEAEAIPAPAMRDILESALQALIPNWLIEYLKVVEKHEQQELREILGG